MRKDLEQFYPLVVEAFQRASRFSDEVRDVLLSEEFKERFEKRYDGKVVAPFLPLQTKMLNVLSDMEDDKEELYGLVTARNILGY